MVHSRQDCRKRFELLRNGDAGYRLVEGDTLLLFVAPCVAVEGLNFRRKASQMISMLRS